MADIRYSEAGASTFDYGNGQDDRFDQGAAGADPSRVGKFVNWAGAFMSVGLVVAAGIWAWQLVVRDVSDVPVIRALEGPMRVAPNDPGGSIAENQGLAVNRLAEGEEAAPVPDQLVLAPEPIELLAPADSETPSASEFEAGSPSAPVSGADVSPELGSVSLADVDGDPRAGREEETSAIVERLIAEATALETEDGASALGSRLPQLGSAEVIPISVPGVRRSLRPQIRPAAVAARATPASSSDAAPATEIEPQSIELLAAELDDGTRLVQLGAFDSADLARGEWARLSAAFPDFFLDRARVIEEATSGGQTFYRLRAHGFEDLAASRRFCAVLVAEGAACIPVTVR